jgi:hypothetical protein
MKAILLRCAPLLVFGVVIALALWVRAKLYRNARRRRNVPPSPGRAGSGTSLEREPNA